MAAKGNDLPKPAPAARNRRMPSKSGEGAPAASRGAPQPAQKPSRGASVLGALVGMIIGAGGIGALSWASTSASTGCGLRRQARPPAPMRASAGKPAPAVDVPPAPDDSNEPEVPEPDAPKKADADKPWAGPWLGAMAQVTPIYPMARFSRNRLGYLRRGGKAPALDKPIRTESCKQGFYPLVDGGYVCGKYATLDVDDPRVKMGVKPPDLDGDLPYKYAYNTAHGTPLYAQVPSREEMLKYEPYLKEKKKRKKGGDDDIAEADQPHADGSARPIASAAPGSKDAQPKEAEPREIQASASAQASADGAPSAEPVDELPWWQRDSKDKLDIKLAQLEEGDGVIAKRMVKGFFIAIDRGFSWNDRLWWKTTDGLIAPADRMVIPKTPVLQGYVFSEGDKQIGFVRVVHAFKYERGKDGKGFVRKGKLDRFAAIVLTGATELYDKQRYYEAKDGFWMREADGTITEPGPRPDRVGEGEKWIDVNLAKKTLVAFSGDKPLYAALISPGKTSPSKEKDHRTKTGIFRIREKHIATTMDGDGPAPGDLPYSIMDVPYVQYYDGSYALHAAFWHNNFGREQSHGCVNLSPKDAKWLFNWTDPPLPRGWHGVWASDKRKGTWVVIHE